MSTKARPGRADREVGHQRELAGASGVWWPMGEEFLYRSPAAPLRDSCRRCNGAARRGRQ